MTCRQCGREYRGGTCTCGYVPTEGELTQAELRFDGTELVRVVLEDPNSEEREAKTANRKDTREMKETFLAELRLHAKRKGYNRGWASHQYRAKYGVWPNKIDAIRVHGIGERTKNWITHQNIKRAKDCLLYTSPSPRDGLLSRMPSSA